MDELNGHTYWEIIIHPNDFVEYFADFIIEKTSCGIEYLDIALDCNPFAITYDDSSWQSVGFSISQAKQSTQSLQIISRVNANNINTPLFIESLKDFTSLLSKNTQEPVGFCFHVEEKPNDDWVRAYKESIQPVQCGKFYIRPSWRDCLLEGKNYEEIIINPALAFGSGHHASTLMCLEFLNDIDLRAKKLLDVGCGSGILGIAATKLGAEVYACDTDEYAVKESHKNVLLNNVSFEALWHGSIDKAPLDCPSQYDVIVVNIVAFVIKLLRNDLHEKCSKNGLLILSGILDEYKFDIIKHFSNFKVLETRSQDEWVALKLTL